MDFRLAFIDSCFCISDIIDKVRAGGQDLFRPDPPKLIDAEENPDVVDLMKACWEENPADRPDCDQLQRRLKAINKGECVSFDLVHGRNRCFLLQWKVFCGVPNRFACPVEDNTKQKQPRKQDWMQNGFDQARKFAFAGKLTFSTTWSKS